jgi:hypothetical protein
VGNGAAAPRGAIKIQVVNGAAGTEYIRVSAAARRHIPGHKARVSIDLNKVRPGKASKSSPPRLGDPTWALWHLLAVSSGVSQAGQATVAGVPATEYRAQVSLDKVAAKVQATEGARDAQLVRSEIKALSIASLPVEVWIDAHHLIRQIRFQAPGPDRRHRRPQQRQGGGDDNLHRLRRAGPLHAAAGQPHRRHYQRTVTPAGPGQLLVTPARRWSGDHCRLAHMSSRPEASSPGGRPGLGFHS